MSETNSNLTPFEKAFQHNLEIRPCGYDPLNNFDTYEDVEQGLVKQILGLQYKLLWFYSYCRSMELEGRVESDDFNVMIFESAGTGMVSAKARVYIGEICVATGSASKGFTLNAASSMDAVIQNATGSALSRALSAAGFGAVSSNEPDIPPAGFADMGGPLPFTMSAEPAASHAAPQVPPAPNVQGTGNASAAQLAGPEQQTSLFQQPEAPQADPLAAAKVEMWPCSGYYAGKTLGEILATKPDKIIWLAEKYTKDCPAKEAAKALLPEAMKRCGK